MTAVEFDNAEQVELDYGVSIAIVRERDRLRQTGNRQALNAIVHLDHARAILKNSLTCPMDRKASARTKARRAIFKALAQLDDIDGLEEWD